MAARPIREVGGNQRLVEVTFRGPNGLQETHVVDIRVGSEGDVRMFPDGDLGGGEPPPSATPAPLGEHVQANRLLIGTDAGGSGTVSLPSMPRPGSLIVSGLVVDKDATGITVPANLTALGGGLPYLQASVSGHLVARQIGDVPTDADRHAAWSYTAGSASLGAQAVILEIGSGGGTVALANAAVTPVSTATPTTLTVDPGATTTEKELTVGLVGIDSSTGGNWSASSGDPRWSGGFARALDAYGNATSGDPLHNGGAAASLATKVATASGTAMAPTATWTGGDQAFLAAARFTVTGGDAAPAGSVIHRMQGAVTANGFTVSAKVSSGVSGVRAKTGTVFTPPVQPDAYGWVKLVFTGLAAGTSYPVEFELDGVLTTAKKLTVRTMPASPTSLRIGFGSCDNSSGNDSPVYDRMLARGVQMLAHLGDWDYANISTNDLVKILAAREGRLNNPGLARLLAAVWLIYIWSDHDFGGNNSYSATASKAAVQDAYRRMFPHYTLPSTTGGVYHAFSYGTLTRHIVTDLRSYKSNPANTDDANKTMLGSEQKAWFKDQITAATEDLIVWHMENAWVGGPSTSDWWGNYITERTELASFIVASGKRLIIIAGDMHALAWNDGGNSPGGIPVFHAAAFERTASQKGGPYTAGPYPSSGTTIVKQYGVLDIIKSIGSLLLDEQFNGTHVLSADDVTDHPLLVVEPGSSNVSIGSGILSITPGSTEYHRTYVYPRRFGGPGKPLTVRYRARVTARSQDTFNGTIASAALWFRVPKDGVDKDNWKNVISGNGASGSIVRVGLGYLGRAEVMRFNGVTDQYESGSVHKNLSYTHGTWIDVTTRLEWVKKDYWRYTVWHSPGHDMKAEPVYEFEGYAPHQNDAGFLAFRTDFSTTEYEYFTVEEGVQGLRVDYTGYDSTDTARITGSKVWGDEVKPPPPPKVPKHPFSLSSAGELVGVLEHYVYNRGVRYQLYREDPANEYPDTFPDTFPETF